VKRFAAFRKSCRGHEGIRRYWETIRGPGTDLTMHVARVVEVGEEVLILFHFHAKGRAGLEFDARFGQVATTRDGLVTRLDAYPNWDSAARAVDLPDAA
jgi:ketosteroid isomerase-like protein